MILQQEEMARTGVVYKIVKILSETLTQGIANHFETAVQALKEIRVSAWNVGQY